MTQCFTAWRKWAAQERPGFGIDMDMIPFGRLALMCPPFAPAASDTDVALARKGKTRWSSLSSHQMRTFITTRGLAASPLFVGSDLLIIDPYSLRLLTDLDMVACDEKGRNGEVGSRGRSGGSVGDARTRKWRQARMGRRV